MFSDADCDQMLRSFRFISDDRNPPDQPRRGAFKQGWNATHISRTTLDKRLTWKNLGYRLAQSLSGRVVDPDDVFDTFAAHYERHGRILR